MEGLGQPQVAGPGPHQGVRAALSCPSRLCRGQRGHATGLKCWLPPGTDWSCTGSLDGARVGSALGGRVVHSQRGRSDSCFPLGPLKSVPGGREGSGQRARSSGFGQRATGASEILEQGPELPFPALLDRRGACCRAGSAEPHLSSSVRGEGRPPCFAAPSWFTQHPGQLSIGSHHWTPAWGLLYVCFICHLLLWPGRAFAWLTGGHAGNSGRGAVEPGGVRAVAWPGSCPSCVLHIPDAAFSRKGGRAEEWWR